MLARNNEIGAIMTEYIIKSTCNHFAKNLLYKMFDGEGMSVQLTTIYHVNGDSGLITNFRAVTRNYIRL